MDTKTQLARYDDNYREVAKAGLSTDRPWPAWNELLEKDTGHFLFSVPDTVHLAGR